MAIVTGADISKLLDELQRERNIKAELLTALQKIRDNGDKCIYSHDLAFQEGSHAAFVVCAEFAARALVKAEPEQ